MSYSVRWTDKARLDYIATIDYLQLNWGDNSINKFIIKVDKHLQLIQEMPKINPVTGFFKGLRKCVLVKKKQIPKILLNAYYFFIRVDSLAENLFVNS